MASGLMGTFGATSSARGGSAGEGPLLDLLLYVLGFRVFGRSFLNFRV